MKKTGISSAQVRQANRNQIFRYICRAGRVSNPELAYELKMSLPTVTTNTRELVERGLIAEEGEFQSTGGRKAKAYRVCADARVAIGLDLTRNHVGLVVTNLVGAVVKYERIQKPFSDTPEYYTEVCRLIEAFIADRGYQSEQILGLGISIPGIVDEKADRITDSHALKLVQVSCKKLREYFPWSCRFSNDANAGAYAEGRARREDGRLFYLSLSNTVGGAVYERGGLVLGDGFRCGEAGHMTIIPNGKLCYCGKRGCLDAYCSASVLDQHTGGKLGMFFAALEKGNPEYIKIWEEYVSYLAVAVNNLRMLLDCTIVLGGYVGSYLEKQLPMLRERVSARNTFTEDGSFLQSCQYKIEAAALGAALQVIDQFIAEV